MNTQKIFSFILPEMTEQKADGAVLALRIIFGLLLLTHGATKIVNFTALATQFPDPLGVGQSLSLSLAIFAEVLCSLAFIIGLLTRPACLVMAFNMLVALGAVHHFDILGVGELAFLYLVPFVIVLFTGAGKYSVDHLISQRVIRK